MQEKTLKVQEERNLSSELITKGREWVDSATTHVDNVQDTLTVSSSLGSHTTVSRVATQLIYVCTRTLVNQYSYVYTLISPHSTWSVTEMSSFCGPVNSGPT